jgi:Flp pilus assembly pilin Flp
MCGERRTVTSRFVVFWSVLRADRGAVTAMEYGLVASLVAVVIIMSLDMLGNHFVRIFDKIATNI